jgi:phosphoglycerate kinase
MQNIDQCNFSGLKVLVRVDFNVPLDSNYHITDDTRIVASLPTIKKIITGGGAVILMSHLGRPKGKYDPKYSLKHIVQHLSELLNTEVLFAPDCIGQETKQKVKTLKAGEVLLLENVRFHKEEEEGDIQFSKELAGFGDIFVNDAFASAHRAHASTTVVAKYFTEKIFGYLVENEINSLDKVLSNPVHPFTAIIGGAKVSTKITILENLMDKVDNMIIGGGMAFTFIKARGGNVGASMVEEDKLHLSLRIFELAGKNNVKIYLPTDAVIADKFDNNASTDSADIVKISDGWMGLDIGDESIKKFCEIIENSKTILWNGPMGVFEMPNFENGTVKIAKAIITATLKGSYSLVGGGDTVAAINKYKLADKVSYVSTAGGAMLEYLEGKELPGIKAVRSMG